MDSWISQFFVYPDTWIHGYLDIVDIMDTWILGYFNFFSFRIMDSQKSLDIQVSGYPTIRISHPYLQLIVLYSLTPNHSSALILRNSQKLNKGISASKIDIKSQSVVNFLLTILK